MDLYNKLYVLGLVCNHYLSSVPTNNYSLSSVLTRNLQLLPQLSTYLKSMRIVCGFACLRVPSVWRLHLCRSLSTPWLPCLESTVSNTVLLTVSMSMWKSEIVSSLGVNVELIYCRLRLCGNTVWGRVHNFFKGRLISVCSFGWHNLMQAEVGLQTNI